ncbi:MAG: penicillin-binding protein 2 [Syntrophales bacterium]
MSQSNNRLSRYDSSRFRRKFNVLLWIISVSLSVLVVRMWYLQVIKGDELRQRSENNRIRINEIKPLRGTIIDTKGTILAGNQPCYDVSIVPGNVKNVKAVVKMLEDFYRQEGIDFSRGADAVDRARSFVPIKLAKNISRRELAVVETHSVELPGVSVEVIPVRRYLMGEMTAHVLGYVSEISPDELKSDASRTYKPGDRVGKYGIEKFLDRFLKGISGGEHVEVNVSGRRVRVLGKVDPVPGHNAILTLDADLQKTAWEAMEGKVGSVVAMDPRDGSVRVLLSRPSFDPNLFNQGIPIADWESLCNDPLRPMENKAIAGQYPPGSTYKMIIAAAALQEGLITPDTAFNCTGSYQFGNRTYRCWQKKGHGRVSLHRAIVQSCDVYFYNVGRIVGVDKIAEYARAFGLGEPTGIDLPGEKYGLVPTREWKLKRFREPWQLGETLSISIGQGFNLVTPIQLLNAYCALANGGTLYKPRLVERIETIDRQIIKEFKPEVKAHLPLSKETIELLKYGLWGVCNEGGGTGGALRRKEADVAGKTGTAQVVAMKDDRKSATGWQFRDHALFVAFAPVDNPEIAVAVIVEHGGHGGSAAAPVARKVIDAYFRNKAANGVRQQAAAQPGNAGADQKKATESNEVPEEGD